MMKKKKLLYIGTLTLSLFMSGCSDSFLDMNNYGAYDNFDSETKVNWYLASLYYNCYRGYTTPGYEIIGWYGEDWNFMTDEEWGIKSSSKIDPNSNYSTIDDIKTWEISSNKYYDPLIAGYFGAKLSSNVTNSSYTRIRNCNILIRDIEDASVTREVKNHAKGQALFLRAAQLFDLVRLYGPVPVVTTVLNATANGDKMPRASVTQCVEQMVNDLNEAATLLPDEWPASDYGRPTSGTALAYKSRILLTYASPIFNKDWDNPKSIRWEKALKASQQAVQSMTLNGLDGCSDAKGWGELLAKDDNSFNKEAVFVKLLSNDNVSGNAETNRWEGSTRLSSQSGGGGKAVPMELIDLFPMADGTRPKEEDKIANGNIRFIENREPRFYYTFAFSGMQWGYNGKLDDVVWAYRWNKSAEGSSFSYSDGNNVASPVFVRKMSGTNTVPESNYGKSSIDIYDYRYAELILNLAECYAATGDIQNCKETLGKLRKRVGMPEGSQYYGLDETVRDRHSALEACLYERRIELAYEGKRYWDIWRWLLYDGGQGEGLKLSSTNTCTTLGIKQLNGSTRTSKYLDLKEGTYVPGSGDVLQDERINIKANPDDSDFQEQVTKLADFWEENFQFGDPTSPADKDANNNPVSILWRPNYYIHGLAKDVLDNNSWLGQTRGWTDQNGAAGTIEWQDDETLTVD
ncbi:RagB/SusD family nutrient uptake outer membrane protein [Bacteroides thetaiotaomicron]|uniref:RagB/SusD family nutrient uptake outer membrane protein n=1 Tax=Bacteroides thetaiotaomicron TaxID=818 RepID=UPI0028F414FC|nr:RagB/SusD family nutrient uptake outer membrane protein [Bacteroides thetaiotaomicron]WOG19149.1 RagB/SusD family nutrient uptake outer membrane protein [Bacteroides thetaiotaomicron]